MESSEGNYVMPTLWAETIKRMYSWIKDYPDEDLPCAQGIISSYPTLKGYYIDGDLAGKAIPPGKLKKLIKAAAPQVKPMSPIPGNFCLLQNYPNFFNPDTWIPYQLVEDVDVTIEIHDASGQLVRTLKLGHKPAGFYTTKDRAAYWDGKNEAGEQVTSGIYFYTIQAGDFTATKKMVVAK
jgi:hypothetical protein